MNRDEISMAISDAFLERLADQIADRVVRRVRPLIAEQAALVRSMELPLGRTEVTLLRLVDVVKRTGLSRTTIYQMMNAGTFPKSVKLGPRTVAWRREEIEAWEATLS